MRVFCFAMCYAEVVVNEYGGAVKAMGLLRDLARNTVEKEGSGDPPPSGGVKLYLYLLHNHFWKLMKLNLLFVLFSLPVLTLPASLTAANRVCIKLVRDGNVFLWSEFWSEFKSSYAKSLCIALPTVGLLFWSVALVVTGGSGGAVGTVMLVVAAALAVFALLWSAYAFVLLALLDIPTKAVVRNAFYLMFLGLPYSLGVLLAQLVALVLGILLYPFSILLLILILPALLMFTLCLLINTPAQRWIIDPYEKQSERDA